MSKKLSKALWRNGMFVDTAIECSVWKYFTANVKCINYLLHDANFFKFWPTFVYFQFSVHFHNLMTISMMHNVLGIRTRGCSRRRVEGTDKSTVTSYLMQVSLPVLPWFNDFRFSSEYFFSWNWIHITSKCDLHFDFQPCLTMALNGTPQRPGNRRVRRTDETCSWLPLWTAPTASTAISSSGHGYSSRLEIRDQYYTNFFCQNR